jgi:hypothetical protein
MSRFRIFDVLESRWMHIGYDTRSSANRAAKRMRKAAGDESRYRLVDQQSMAPAELFARGQQLLKEGLK